MIQEEFAEISDKMTENKKNCEKNLMSSNETILKLNSFLSLYEISKINFEEKLNFYQKKLEILHSDLKEKENRLEVIMEKRNKERDNFNQNIDEYRYTISSLKKYHKKLIQSFNDYGFILFSVVLCKINKRFFIHFYSFFDNFLL